MTPGMDRQRAIRGIRAAKAIHKREVKSPRARVSYWHVITGARKIVEAGLHGARDGPLAAVLRLQVVEAEDGREGVFKGG